MKEEKRKDPLTKLSHRIIDLEIEVIDGRENLKREGFTAEAWEKHQAKVRELEDLKDRFHREKRLREQYKKKFLQNSFGTAEDFERLWPDLRDKALLEQAEGIESMRRNNIYNEF